MNDEQMLIFKKSELRPSIVEKYSGSRLRQLAEGNMGAKRTVHLHAGV